MQLDALIYKTNSNLLQYGDTKLFNINYFSVENSIKILKDTKKNKILVSRLDSDSISSNNNNMKYLADIIKDGDKYYFVPFMNELSQERDSIKDIPWLIYYNKTEPEINHEYYIKEGDVIKLGNAVFKVKLIQVNNNNNLNKDIYDGEYEENIKNENNGENNTFILAGSANHSLILNDEDKFNNLGNLNIHKITIFPNTKKNKDIKKEKNKNKLCRICYQEEDESLINPLIRPCKCSGSMKYIHLKCLLLWLKSKTIRNQSSVMEHNDFFNSYFINEKIECELCKEQFPDYIKHNNIKYCLIDFDYIQENRIKKHSNPLAQNFVNTNNDVNNENENNNIENKDEKKNNNFIILDAIYPLNDGNRYRCIIKFQENNQIIIGRGLENQLVLNEITVSRMHCSLNIQKNKFGKNEVKLQDCGSKFGTLVLLQSNRYEIIKDNPLHVQIDNVYLKISMPYTKSFFSCCNAEVIDGNKSYENVNIQFIKKNYKFNVLTEGNSDDDDNDNNNINEDKSDKNKINKNDNSDKCNINKIKEEKKLELIDDNKNNIDDLILYDIKKEYFIKQNMKNTLEKTDKNEKNNIKADNKGKKQNVLALKKLNIIKEIKDKKNISATSPKNKIESDGNILIDAKSEIILNKKNKKLDINSEGIESIVISVDKEEN